MGNSTEDVLITIPADLLLDIEATANAEHRENADVVRDALRQYIARRPQPRRQWRDPEEKARAFEAWARSFPHTPPLSDEAISRENLVRDVE